MHGPQATPRLCGRRFPLDPLRQQYWVNRGGLLPSNRELAALLDVHVRQVQRWVSEGGLAEPYADRIACRLGVHPSWIWLDWWDDDDDVRYSLTAAGRQSLQALAGAS